MIRRIIGAVLAGTGVVGAAVLVSRGMFLPHIAGPIILILIGVALLVYKGASSQSA
jgi:hypothetical protein